MDKDELLSTVARFDANWVTFDENDLSAIRHDAGRFGDGTEFRNDADSLLFARQLDYVKTQTYNRKYPEMMGMKLVPVVTDTPEWAETITVRVFDEVGIAKIISNYADDLPRSDVRAIERTVRVRTIGAAYGYNVNEVRAARALGVSLDTRKASSARRSVDQKLNRISFSGDPEYNMLGLLNNPNVALVIPVVGSWQNGARTGLEILSDLNAIFNAVLNQSNGVHRPNTLALPAVQYSIASTLPLLGMPGQTAMSFWKQQHPEIMVEIVYETKGAGITNVGSDVMFLYEKNEENIRHELVMPFSQMPPQERNLEFVVPCMARSAGVAIEYPLAFAKMEGI